ncbi:hypothetical protein COLO4_22454 [Corchorus olitorius]|uniref:Uncharacterized protein n=1 Tax=Corchorus olitorius TaxID=93759 RepID=A0A1R3ILU4_9ROSI|nr:hypothetical protein COLO4_22454 [Corchorus olitorius]
MPIVPMSKVEVSSPLESSSIADLNDKERKRKQFAEFMAWVRYMVISSTLTIAFGAMWVDMTHKKLKKQQGFEVYRIFLVCYLFGLVAYNIRQCPNKEAIWKIGLGVERDDDDEEKIRVINIKERYIMFRSPGTSFFLACFSSNLVWDIQSP